MDAKPNFPPKRDTFLNMPVTFTLVQQLEVFLEIELLELLYTLEDL